MNPIELFFPVTPVPKGRPRFVRNGKFVATYTDPKTKEFEKTIHLMAKQFKNEKYPDVFLESCPIYMNVIFFLPRPKSQTKKQKQNFHHFKRPDLDNYIKAWCDSIQGVFFKDDAQICKLEAEKVYADWEEVGISTWICEL